MKKYQERVEQFMDEYDMDGTPAFAVIDLMAEAGEIASDAAKSADYGLSEEKMEIKQDEFGDVLFSLFVLANRMGVDMEEAFDDAIKKYESRIEETGDAGSK
jgi:NTP pyrophosphatase (non-canonical NTP hydrolase)